VRTAQEVDDFLVHGKGLRARWSSKRMFESLNNAKNKKLEKAFHKVEMAPEQMSFADHAQHLPSG
jgi:cellobiose-specific phosphotransferase system component IIA